MSIRTKATVIVFAAAGIFGLAPLAAAATSSAPAGVQPETAAASVSSAPTARETATNHECVADVDTGSLTCFTTAQEADSFADARQARGGWQVHVKLFDKTGYTSPSIRLGSAARCSDTTSDVDGVAPNLARFGWSNRASSFLTRNNCDMKAWDGKNHNGDHFPGYRDHDKKLGALNNKISSYKIS